MAEEKLKTLKDFEFHKSAKEIGCCQECGYLQKGNDLKQEAIQDIKELEKFTILNQGDAFPVS